MNNEVIGVRRFRCRGENSRSKVVQLLFDCENFSRLVLSYPDFHLYKVVYHRGGVCGAGNAPRLCLIHPYSICLASSILTLSLLPLLSVGGGSAC